MPADNLDAPDVQEESPDERFRVGAIWALIGTGTVLRRVLGRGGAAVDVFAARTSLRQAGRARSGCHAELAERGCGLRTPPARGWIVLARVRHPGVVDIIDGGDINGIPFIAMHLLDGRTLSGLIAARGRLEPVEVAKMESSSHAEEPAAADRAAG